MPLFLHRLRYCWLPGLLLAAVAAQYFNLLSFRGLLLPKLPYLLLGIALSLGIFFKLSRVAFVAALLLAGYTAVNFFQVIPAGETVVGLALALAAVNISLVSISEDRSPLNGFGVLLMAVITAQGMALAELQRCCSAQLAGWLHFPVGSILPPWLPDILRRVQSEDLLLISAAAFAGLRAFWRPEHIGVGLFACVLLLLGAYYTGAEEGTLVLVAVSAGLLLTLLALRSAYELAFRDELTGIPSRRAYSRYLLTLGRRYSIAVVDIDHFKKLNDRYGHQVGDQALRMVAGQIDRYGGGRAFRYGGEEFVVVLRGGDNERASRSLERMREKIADYPLRLRGASRPRKGDSRALSKRGQGGGKVIKTTVSVGLASSSREMRSPEDVLGAADRALYRAKRGGRNRVCVHK
ncbi:MULTISPECIES: GGDEF domain-containing protein [unclassified Microbulbifer]|uniref:GGDEF domain-containing protein n=1 Tax=unclassified Microbulbifer TaxID=2619833 RepID=UPI0027E508A5|nr:MULTISPECIES: GGDEF domain-containing protein [unclassified Microbulbifer]